MINFLLVYSCGLVDRIRGSGEDNAFYSKSVESFIYGLFVAALLDLSLEQAVGFGVLWAVGASFGWGEPLGAMLSDRRMKPTDYEWWQFGPLKDSPIFACAFRGLMWGGCIAPFSYFNIYILFFVAGMTIIFPLAIWLAIKLPYVTSHRWSRQEYYRGWLVGVAALLLSILKFG